MLHALPGWRAHRWFLPLCLGVILGCRSESPAPVPEKVDGSLVVKMDPVKATRAVPRKGAPNIVLLIGCTIRQDQVSPYGGPPGLTPELTRLASMGARLEDPIAAAPWTKASSASILTGHHAIDLSLVETGDTRNDNPIGDDAVLLAQRFRAAGYSTYGASANPNLSEIFGFAKGFDHYLQPEGLWRESGGKITADVMLPHLLEGLDARDPDRPVYLQVMLIDAHSPYPKGEIEREPGDQTPVAVGRYRKGLAAFDEAVGRLRKDLASRGLTDENTYFVLTSDHGEGLRWPEHHGRAHGRYLYGSAIRALGMAVGPGIPAGRTVPGMASGVDITPTILGLAALPGYQGPGIDLSPALRGERERTDRPYAISDTWFQTANRSAIVTDQTVCMRSFRKRERRAPTGQFNPGCYDRASDPYETTPLSTPDTALMKALTSWRERRVPSEATAVPIDSDLAGQLEALGYTEK